MFLTEGSNFTRMKNKYLTRSLCVTILSAMVLSSPMSVMAADEHIETASDLGDGSGEVISDGTEVADLFSKYRLSEALMAVYKLFWDEFSSWYLEIYLRKCHWIWSKCVSAGSGSVHDPVGYRRSRQSLECGAGAGCVLLGAYSRFALFHQ